MFNGNEKFILFLIFNIIIILMLMFDLGAFSKKKSHIVPLKEAALRTSFWVLISLLFAILVLFLYPAQVAKTKTLEYLTGYLLEYTLSVDNLFVFIMIFQKFKISPSFQPEILKWGIIGALILRGIMIYLGSSLITKFDWLLYVFGALLLYTAWKMFTHDEKEEYNEDANIIIRLAKKTIPFTPHHHQDRFFVKESGRRIATPLFITLIIIEISDVMFALDSIPAVFSITTDPLIVYTSNVFAIIGLRSLFFLINGIMDLFIHLQKGVSVILAFVGLKMLLPFLSDLLALPRVHVPIGISLSVISSILLTSIIFSLPEYNKRKNSKSRGIP